MKTAFWVLDFIFPVKGLVQPVQDNLATVKRMIDTFNKHDWQKTQVLCGRTPFQNEDFSSSKNRMIARM